MIKPRPHGWQKWQWQNAPAEEIDKTPEEKAEEQRRVIAKYFRPTIFGKYPPQQTLGTEALRKIEDIVQGTEQIRQLAEAQTFWFAKTAEEKEPQKEMPKASYPEGYITDLDVVNFGLVVSWITSMAEGRNLVTAPLNPDIFLINLLTTTAETIAQHPVRFKIMNYWGEVYNPPQQGYPVGTPSRRAYFLDRVRKLSRAGFIKISMFDGTRIDHQGKIRSSAIYCGCPTEIGVVRAEWAAIKTGSESPTALAKRLTSEKCPWTNFQESAEIEVLPPYTTKAEKFENIRKDREQKRAEMNHQYDERRQKVVNLLKMNEPVAVIVKETGYCDQSVRNIAKKEGIVILDLKKKKKEMRAIVVKMLKDSNPIEKIQKNTGFHKNTIQKIARQEKITIAKESKEQDIKRAKVISLLKAKKTVPEIVAATGYTEPGVRSLARRSGIEIAKVKKIKGKKHSKTKTSGDSIQQDKNEETETKPDGHKRGVPTPPNLRAINQF